MRGPELRLTALCGAILAGWFSAGAFGAPAPLIDPAHRLAPDALEWRSLAALFAKRPDAMATFEELRYFSFRKEPVILKGEVRVSREHGLSLYYLPPDERTIIIDQRGLIVRDASGRDTPPADPRANAANEALRHILRFDLDALAAGFETYGRRSAESWSLALVPRATAMRRAMGNILVEGANDAVRRIEIRRSAQQRIEIVIATPQPGRAFTAEERRRYFR